MNQHIETIDEVIGALNEIIEKTVDDDNHLCIFAYVYKRTTEKIREGIRSNFFEDNARMERLDVCFAKRYIDAFWLYDKELKPLKSWYDSFKAGDKNLSAIQHLLTGMNAHINLDLGIAAAEICSKENIHSIHNDFLKVNEILSGLTGEMQNRISKISPAMGLLGAFGGKKDDAIINFSITKARDFAWQLALALAPLEGLKYQQAIDSADSFVSGICKLIVSPPGKVLNIGLCLISFFEVKDASKIVQKLEA